ncbi:MAG: hypothetical protein ACSHX7_03180 [Luteolibacter sp.]
MKTLLIINRVLLCGLCVSMANAQDDSEYENFVRQLQLPDGTVWSVPVEAEGEQQSMLAIDPGGARFELHTVKSDPLVGYLLDTKYVSTYTPVGEVIIRTEDPYATVPRTRADRPFWVELTAVGLRDGEDDPEPSKKVKVLRHVQSYGIDGTGTDIDRTQASLIGQGFLEDNGVFQLNYEVSSVPGEDRAKIRGEERFSIYSLEDYQAPESHLDSLYVQIWPVADGQLSGIADNTELSYSVPSVTFTVNDLYPDSQVYVQVYQGDQQLGTEGTVVPGSAIIINESVPQDRTITLTDWDSVLTANGSWTMELVTSTPFGIDRLDYVSFTVDRTISVNGTVTTLE